MNAITCCGEYYVCEPIYDGDKVIDLTRVPIVAWQIEEGMYNPIAADTLFWDCPNDFVIKHQGKYYDYGLGMTTKEAVMAMFQRKHDKSKDASNRHKTR